MDRELIAEIQDKVAQVKRLLAEIDADSGKVVTINHEAGRFEQSADAMIWQGAVKRLRGDLLAAHGVASKALVRGYGEEIVAAGPIR